MGTRLLYAPRGAGRDETAAPNEGAQQGVEVGLPRWRRLLICAWPCVAWRRVQTGSMAAANSEESGPVAGAEEGSGGAGGGGAPVSQRLAGGEAVCAGHAGSCSSVRAGPAR